MCVFVLVQRVHLNQGCVLKLILVDMLTGKVTVSIECGTTSLGFVSIEAVIVLL